MALQVQLISDHPLVRSLLAQMFQEDPRFGPLASSDPPGISAPASQSDTQLRLFILDAASLEGRLTEVLRLSRVRYPGSKSLVLLPPEQSDPQDLLRLLYAGIDGAVILRSGAEWKDELFAATRWVLSGNLWFPPQVVAEYVRNTNLLLDEQVRPNLSLTARENQILQLMVRRLSNKEIGGALGISQRTVKFHVANIFSKLRIHTRKDLYSAATAGGHPLSPSPEKA